MAKAVAAKQIKKIEQIGELVQNFPIGDVKPYAKNPKKHPQAQIDELAKDFEAVGFHGVIVIDEENVVLSGHGRLLAAKQAGFKTIPVHKSLGLSDAQKAYYRIRDNSIPGMASFDEILLQSESDIAKIGGFDVSLLNDSDEARHKKEQAILDQMESFQAEADDLADKIPVEIGDIFELGSHKIICGDSSKKETYELLLGEERCEMVFTDPPYGVSYEGNGLKKNSIVGDKSETILILSFAQMVKLALDENARIYFCGGNSNAETYAKLFNNELGQHLRLIVWDKVRHVNRYENYHSQFELIFFGWKGKGGDKWFGDRKQMDLWVVKRDPSADYIHPTQKPVELPARAITNSCSPGGLVLDPFLGSGSTLIAAEGLGRRCRGVEIDPHFVRKMLCRYYSFAVSKGEPSPVITQNGRPIPLAVFDAAILVAPPKAKAKKRGAVE